ncbi:MAG: fructose-6-phosphate aldolase [Candidatus Eisenbacteria bacterium]|uniref:Probable transaldolase n=1 Tax=Eiseniibacteriota bacterium TaxID=2212470 RepID=A0A937XCJ1_UNCEI|nr:fructose-6-phosphate aldolase [Candidatus Eisenbacteria bacterium]
MKFFLDTAIREEIRDLAALGFVDGVTTNPSLLKEARAPYRRVLEEICRLVSGPVSAEVLAEESAGMLREARELAAIAPNIVIKVPMGSEGLRAAAALHAEGVGTNVTLVFSANQALLAAKAGARFVSPFIGRLDDVGQSGMALIEEILDIYGNYDFETEVIVASVRHPMHVVEAARLGADIVTMPAKVLRAMFAHPLTDVGKAKFLEAWREVERG